MQFYKLKQDKRQEAVDFINGNPNFPYNNTTKWVDGYRNTIHGYSVILKIPDDVLNKFSINDDAKAYFMNTYTDGIVDLTAKDFPQADEVI